MAGMIPRPVCNINQGAGHASQKLLILRIFPKDCAKLFVLEHRIVVIGLSDTPPANLPHYEGEPLKACQMLDTVRLKGNRSIRIRRSL